MNRKDYVAIAEALREAKKLMQSRILDEVLASLRDGYPVESETLTTLAMEAVRENLVQVFRADNVRFDAERFRQYVDSQCIMCGGPVTNPDADACSVCAKKKASEL